jgi:hypothetical protein
MTRPTFHPFNCNAGKSVETFWAKARGGSPANATACMSAGISWQITTACPLLYSVTVTALWTDTKQHGIWHAAAHASTIILTAHTVHYH